VEEKHYLEDHLGRQARLAALPPPCYIFNPTARPLKPLPIVSNLPKFSPIIPVRRPDIFDSSDWIYELKYDGFRALAYIDEGRCRFVSHRGNEMKKVRAAFLCDRENTQG
jgi:hypothetical protein